MSGLGFLDLVIGLVFIYLIYSLACSTIWEIIVNLSYLRGKMLKKWFHNTFDMKLGDSKTLGQHLLDHALVKGLGKSKDDSRPPSYVPAEHFSAAFLEILLSKTNSDFSYGNIKRELANTLILPTQLRNVFLQYVAESNGKTEELRKRIEKWYDDAMNRVGGSFKKYSQRWIFIISMAIVGMTNADTINLTNYLYNNPSAREAIANKAALFVQDSVIVNEVERIRNLDSDTSKVPEEKILDKIVSNQEKLLNLNNEVADLKLPLGWEIESKTDATLNTILKKTMGLLITALAVSLGAPFWFDMLNKLVNIKSSGNWRRQASEKQENNQ